MTTSWAARSLPVSYYPPFRLHGTHLSFAGGAFLLLQRNSTDQLGRGKLEGWGMNTFWKKIQKEGTQVYKHKNIQITNVLVQVKCMINSVEHLLWLHRQLIAMPHVFNSLGRIRSIAIYWSCGQNYFLLFPILWFHNLHGLFDEHSCSCKNFEF